VTTDRELGIELFNKTWALLESPDRDPDELIHCAHASAYHWLVGGGTVANRARSEWQCSRVNAILGRPEAALAHARRCLELVQSSPELMEEFDLPAAYEALARAHLVAGDLSEARRYRELGVSETAKIADEEDRRIMEADLSTILV
jgi:hypothetical protein